MPSILLVDDSESLRLIIAQALKAEGYQCLEAEDGVSALDVLQANSVDLIISDINMPNMNGIDLVSHVRKSPDNKFTPIIMLTTETNQEQKLLAKKAGATAWISKPFIMPKLLNAVTRCLK
jgi:two-component system, chemotaxis family, chemotaxis protein CheY